MKALPAPSRKRVPSAEEVQRLRDATVAAGVREWPHPFANAVSVVSDIDSSGRANYQAYTGLLVQRHGLDFGDSAWLAGGASPQAGLSFLTPDYRIDAAQHSRRARDNLRFDEMLAEHHRGNIDHWHAFSPRGPRAIMLPGAAAQGAEVRIDVPVPEHPAPHPFSVLSFHLTGVLLVLDATSPDPKSLHLQVERSGRDAVSATWDMQRDQDKGVFRFLDARSGGSRPVLFTWPGDAFSPQPAPPANALRAILVRFAERPAPARPIRHLYLLNSHSRIYFDRLALLGARYGVAMNLVTTHSGWHFVAEESLDSLKNRMSAERQQQQTGAFEERWGQFEVDGFRFSTMADDDAAFSRVYPDLTERLGLRYLVPYPRTTEHGVSYSVFDVIHPNLTRAGNPVYCLRRTSPAIPDHRLPIDDDDVIKQCRASSFSLRLEQILSEADHQRGRVWTYYTHLGHLGGRRDKPSPYFDEEPLNALKRRVLGLGDVPPGRRIWFTRASVLCDYAYMIQTIAGALQRPDGNTVHIVRRTTALMPAPYPWAPEQLYALCCYVECAASARLFVEGQEIVELVRNGADDSGRESITVAACGIRHPLVYALDPAALLPGDERVFRIENGGWTWHAPSLSSAANVGAAAASRSGAITAFARITLDRHAGSGGPDVVHARVTIAYSRLDPQGCQHLFYSLRRSAPEVRFGILLTTEGDGRFFFGDADLLTDLPVITAYWQALDPPAGPAGWRTYCAPFYDLTWNRTDPVDLPLPSHRTQSICLLVSGPAGEWVELANLEFGRPQTTVPPDRVGTAIVGGRWTGLERRLELHGAAGCEISEVRPDGLFSFGPLAPGAYQLVAGDAGGPAFCKWLDIRCNRFDLSLPDTEPGRPAAGPHVSIMRPATMTSQPLSPKDLQQRIREFDRLALPVLERWLDEHAPAPDPFYAAKLGQSMISGLQSRQLLYLLNTVPQDQSIVEIGAGMGQVPLFLAAQGYRAGGLELAEPRAAAMRWLIGELGAQVGDRCDVYCERFPEARPPADVLLFCNVVNGYMDRNLEPVIDALLDYRRVVLDLRTFGRKRDTDAEQEELRALMSRRGLRVETVGKESGCHIANVTPRTGA